MSTLSDSSHCPSTACFQASSSRTEESTGDSLHSIEGSSIHSGSKPVSEHSCCTSSTMFSGVGAITGRFLYSIGGWMVHGIEYLVKIYPVLKRHKHVLSGQRGTWAEGELIESELTHIVDHLLELSKRVSFRTALVVRVLINSIDHAIFVSTGSNHSKF